MTLKVPLGGKPGSGDGGYGCRGCGEVFTGLSAFDAHQKWKRGVLRCMAPGDCRVSGQRLERKLSGQWGRPAVNKAGKPNPAIVQRQS